MAEMGLQLVQKAQGHNENAADDIKLKKWQEKKKQERQPESEHSDTDSDGKPLTSRWIMGKLSLATLPEGQSPISIRVRTGGYRASSHQS